MRGDWIYWIGWFAVVAFNLAAILVAWWALFHDKSRGRRRCPRCWFDMAYTPGMTCSECGYTGASEKAFHRTRRRYKVAGVAILSCVALAAVVNDRALAGGLPSVLPTRVLLFSVGFVEGDQGRLFRELWNRVNADALTDAQWDALLDKCIHGDFRTEPGTQAWVDKYGDLLERIRQSYVRQRQQNQLSDEELRLLEAAPVLRLDTRTVWPAGAEPRVRVQLDDWWPHGTQTRLTITPRGGEPQTVYRSGLRNAWAGFSLSVPAVEADTTEIVLEVEVAHRIPQRYLLPGETAPDRADDVDAEGDGPDAQPVTPGDDGDGLHSWQTAATRTVRLPVQISGTMEDQFAAFGDDEAAVEALRSTFARGVVKWTSGPSRVRNYYDPRSTHRPLFDDVAFGVSVEILFDGRPARQLDIWWLAGGAVDDRGQGFERVMEDDPILGRVDDPELRDRWTLRITGKPELALRAGGEATMTWTGQFTMPMRVERYESGAPPRTWWTEDEAGADPFGEDEALASDDPPDEAPPDVDDTSRGDAQREGNREGDD